jgi:translation initiation factor IF-2
MAKIRAYKLAEELGIDRAEIVEKAASVGVTLKSAMASVEEEDVEKIRAKFGEKAPMEVVTEKRVTREGGSAVIRRRKKVEPEPVAEPEEPPVPEPIAAVEAPPALEPISEAEAPPPVEEVPPESVSEPIAEVPVPPSEEVLPAATPMASPPPAESRPMSASGRDMARELGDVGPERREGKEGRQRKLVREVVNLREQEHLARQATGRGHLRRQVTVDPRAMTSPRRRRRDAVPPKPAARAAPRESKRVVRVEGDVAIGELAHMLGAKAPEVQKKLMALGTMVSINQSIDVETARKIAADFGYEVQDVGFHEQAYLEVPKEAAAEENAVERPPVVTVMGHVDHGKTSLLDALRKTNVVAGEAGGITQHVGAYQVAVEGKKLTFIDTPGHAAFTDMRARGAQVTDIVVLVVAATEGIMPQTVEAIHHSKAAGVPIVVALNKCDLPGAEPQKARQRLMEHDLVPEDFGGDVICVDVSAKTASGLTKLLEMVSLQAELLELKADPSLRARGVVLEARLDKGRGPVATVLVQEGTLRRGDIVVVGIHWGRVRMMEDENGKRVKAVGPSAPVQVTGLSGIPESGQPIHAVENERVAREIVDHRLAQQRAKPAEARPTFTLDEFFARAEGGGVKELAIVLKADAHGSVEAISDALLKQSTDSVKVDVIHAGVGAITETDVMLAKASGAIIIGFQVRPDPAARQAAEGQGVDVRVYQVIYEVVDDVKSAMVGLLPPTVTEEFQGRAEVRETFLVPRVGTIAGCYVSEGKVGRADKCRLVRDGVQVYEGRIGSLKRFKDDAREVASGFECGIAIDGYNDVKIGDVIETYQLAETPATLE